MYYKNKIILLLLLFCNCFISKAQDATVDYSTGKLHQQEYAEQPANTDTFDKKEWSELKRKLKIKDYTPKKIDSITNETDSLKNVVKNKNWTQNISPKNVKIIQWIIFAIIFFVLLFIILKVLGVQLFTKDNVQKKMQVSLEELEENLDTAAIDPHLHNAIKNKNYKLAIRLYYLMIIQRLALKDRIIWKKYKTNKHYLNELRNKNEHDTLRKLTTIYEQSWFGETTLTENDYDKINPLFANFLHSIN